MKGLKSLLIISMCVLTFSLSAQTSITDANLKFNAGVELAATDPMGAVKVFEECVALCVQVGDEAVETKGRAEKQITSIYLNEATNLYNSKDFAAAVVKFEESVKVSEKYGDTESKEKAVEMITTCNLMNGTANLKAKKYAEAVACFDKVIAANENDAKAYFYKGLALKGANDEEGMLAAFNAVMEKDASGKLAGKAKSQIGKHYYNSGVAALKGKKYAEAVPNLEKAIEYLGENAKILTMIATSCKETKEFDKGIDASLKAIELQKGDVNAVAKLNFTLAQIYHAKGDTDLACETYKKAEVGPVAANAKYQREVVLKCK